MHARVTGPSSPQGAPRRVWHDGCFLDRAMQPSLVVLLLLLLQLLLLLLNLLLLE